MSATPATMGRVLMVALAGLAVSAAPPAQLNDTQKALLRERDRLWKQVQQEVRASKMDEAVGNGRKILALEQEVFGEIHTEVASTLEMLSRLSEKRGKWKEAIAAEQQRAKVVALLYGREHWKATDARQEAADMRLRSTLTPAQRRSLQNAWMLNQQAVQYYQKGEAREAISRSRQALRLRKEILGEKHPDCVQSLNNLAACYDAVGEHRKALPLYLQALRHCKDAQGENHPCYARSLNNLASHYMITGKNHQALPLFHQARRIYHDLLGEQHPDYTNGLNNLASLYKAMGEYRLALPLYQRSLALHEEVLGEKHPAYANSLNNLASLYQAMGKYDRALPLYRQALRLRKDVLGEKHPSYALSLNNLAALYFKMGEHGQALPLYQCALRLRKDVLGERHPDYAQSLNNLAMLRKARGEFRQALALLQQALRLRKDVQGERHPDYLLVLNNLAVLYQAMGEYGKALPLFQRALRLCKEVQSVRHPDWARGMNNLAGLYQDMGEHRQALSLYQQALKLRKEALGEKHPDYAGSLNSLALLYQVMGEHRQALQLLRQALRLRKDVLGEKHPDFVSSLNNLALLYLAMGEYHQALPLFQQSLQMRKEVLGERHHLYALGLNNLAGLYQLMGEHGQALPLLEQALRLRKDMLGENHPDYAASLNNLAATYQARGEIEKALSLFRRALRVRKEVLGQRHPDYALSLRNLAFLYLTMRRQSAYVSLSGQCLVLIRAYLEDNLTVLSDRQRRNLIGEHADSLELFLSRAIGTVGPDFLFEQVAAFKDVISGAFPESKRLERRQPGLHLLHDELRAVCSELARLCSEFPPTRDLSDWRERFDRLDRHKTDLKQQLALAGAGVPQRNERLTAAHVAARLPRQTALVEFLFYRHALRPGARGWLCEHRLLAFIVRRDREPILLELGNADRIHSAVRLWRQSVTAAGSSGPDVIAAALLRQQLWQPIAKHLDGIDTVLIAPDGELSGVPFAALPGEKPGSLLLEQYTFGYLTSGWQLLFPEHTVKSDGLLVLGGADFGTPRADGDPLQRPTNWPALPGAELESRQVEAVFRASVASPWVRLLSGRRAGRGRLLAALDTARTGRRCRYLHLATHGHFDPPRYALPPAVLGAWSAGAAAAPSLAGLTGGLTAALVAQEPGVLNAERGFDPTGRSYRVQEGNPMLLCSLVLAGVNDTGEDGYLSAEEVALLDLDGCELAVLSACETSAGRQAGWQGVQGLQRGFHQAGARHVLASLWSISDPATSVLMEEFYRLLWMKKEPPLQALRQAQLYVLRHPQKVIERASELAKKLEGDKAKRPLLAKRGITRKAKEGVPAAGKGAQSPVAWWAAWVLSGRP